MSRLVFRLQSIPAAGGSIVRIDTASGSATPADVRTLGGSVISGALVRSDSNAGSLPTILGPDSVTTLYQKTLDYRGQVVGSPVTLTGEDDSPSAPTYSGGTATTDASQLTSGTLSAARLPNLAGTYAALTSVETVVTHDGTAGGGTRPTGYSRVRWVSPPGTAYTRPTNMVTGDVWEHDA